MSVPTLLVPPAAGPGTALGAQHAGAQHAGTQLAGTHLVGPQLTGMGTGIGFAPAHHGELLQGMFLDEAGVPQRAAAVLEVFGQQLPPMLVLGCDTAPEEKVDTLRLPPAPYDSSEIARFGVLRAALRRAVAKSDVALLGRVATASARINQRYLPKPHLEP